jgi:hypothetical protein
MEALLSKAIMRDGQSVSSGCEEKEPEHTVIVSFRGLQRSPGAVLEVQNRIGHDGMTRIADYTGPSA